MSVRRAHQAGRGNSVGVGVSHRPVALSERENHTPIFYLQGKKRRETKKRQA